MGREQFGQKDKVCPVIQIASFDYTKFPASTTVFLVQQNVLKPYAKKRSFTVRNTLDQSLTNVGLRPILNGYGSIAYNGYGSTVNPTSLGTTSTLTWYDIGFVGDSIDLVATVPATAPTTGAVIIQVAEVV